MLVQRVGDLDPGPGRSFVSRERRSWPVVTSATPSCTATLRRRAFPTPWLSPRPPPRVRRKRRENPLLPAVRCRAQDDGGGWSLGRL